MKPELEARKQKLLSLAAKPGRTKEPLSGKLKRKDIEKALEKSKKAYSDTKSSLNVAKKKVDYIKTELNAAELKVEELSQLLQRQRESMVKAHALLQEMDLHGAELVKIKGKDKDLMFSIDGRWVKPEGSTETTTPETSPEPVDFDLEDPESNPEGFDFSK